MEQRVNNPLNTARDRSTVLRNLGRPPILSGGGVRVVTSGGVTWSGRFISIGAGQGLWASTNGHFNINPPANGNLIQRSDTVLTIGADRIIPLAGWQTLWWVPPLGGQSDSNSGTGSLRIVLYEQAGLVPEHWVPICSRNGDDGQVTWFDGQVMDYWRNVTWQNGFSDYAVDFGPVRFRKHNGVVVFRGLSQGGSENVAATVMPVGYRPGQVVLGMARTSAGGAIRLDINTGGDCYFREGAFSTGWQSWAAIQYVAEL